MSDVVGPPGEKEYWHDKRLGSGRTRASPALPAPGRQLGDSSSQPVITRGPMRTFRDLRHPLASFLLLVLALILVGVGLLDATGNGALPVPVLRLADCASANSPLLGARGAQFSADFPVAPRPPFLGPAVNDWCMYVFSENDGDYARPLVFGVVATSGAMHENGWSSGDFGSPPYWATRSDLRRVTAGGAAGLEAFQCDQRTDWCYGWLRVSRGRVEWVVTASGNGTRLPRIMAFVRSFRPAPLTPQP
ncbi:MAG: hypothetical protein ABR925_09460 [Acidimicrobiales bacterium]|jgi:hypothetical protein